MSCLCIVVDCDARNWGALVECEGDHSVFYSLLSAIASFASAHLSLSANNSVSILGVDATLTNPLLYAFDLTIQIDMTPTIMERVRTALVKSAGNTDMKCTNQFAPAFATAFCHINRFKKENDGADGRILIINIGSDLAREQNALMNVFFSAHKQGIVVDVANIGEPSPVLQQACDITMGAYIKVEKPKRLLQYLMFFALGGPDSRSKFTLSVASSVDYRASCHCHGTPASIAVVCSVCLSVQCKFNPICPICNTVFKIPGRGRRSRKRRHED